MTRPSAREDRYPDLPELAAVSEYFGTNPLRWLWTRSHSGKETGIGDTSELATAFALVKTIDDRWELAVWAWAEQATRDREHVHRKLRQRDVAIVEGLAGFGAGRIEYPWARATADSTSATSDQSDGTVDPVADTSPVANASPDDDSEEDTDTGGSASASRAAASGVHVTVHAASDGGTVSTRRDGDGCPNCGHSMAQHEVLGETADYCPNCGAFPRREVSSR